MSPPRPAMEARSGSLEPGLPSQDRSANMRHPAGRPHTPPADRMYATDIRQADVRRQTASSLNAPWAGALTLQRHLFKTTVYMLCFSNRQLTRLAAVSHVKNTASYRSEYTVETVLRIGDYLLEQPIVLVFQNQY